RSARRVRVRYARAPCARRRPPARRPRVLTHRRGTHVVGARSRLRLRRSRTRAGKAARVAEHESATLADDRRAVVEETGDARRRRPARRRGAPVGARVVGRRRAGVRRRASGARPEYSRAQASRGASVTTTNIAMKAVPAASVLALLPITVRTRLEELV